MRRPLGGKPSTPNRWKRAGVFGGVTLVAWLSAWVLMRQYVADLFVVPEGSILISRENVVTPAPAGDASPGKGPAPRVGSKHNKREYMEPIVRRNIFDSTNIGKTPTLEPEGDFSATDLEVVLVATIAAEPQSESSALIAQQSGGDRPRAYYIGDMLLGDNEIVAILGREHATLKESSKEGKPPELSQNIRGKPPRVLIRRASGQTEYLEMTGEAYGKDSKPKSSSSSSSSDMVTKAGPNKFIVEQSLIDQITADPEKLTSEVRVSAHKGSDGQTDGFRLSGIRRRSMFKQLGIKNGDIVHTVNGQGLTDANKAAEAYGSLQGVSSFTFEVTRRNERQTFEYEVR